MNDQPKVDGGHVLPQWATNLPRPEYKKYRRVLSEAPWYEIYRINENTYAFYEPGHEQEVISFLLLGTDRALLWDTGMGFSPLRPLVEQLTSLPLTIINSHLHYDHLAGNHEFDHVYAWPSTATILSLSGYDATRLSRQLSAGMFSKPPPDGFIAKNYRIHPWKLLTLNADRQTMKIDGFIANPYSADDLPAAVHPFHTGTAIDLGGRVLEILHTPGHTLDSIMLLDRQVAGLFTGDTIYPAALYAHLQSDEYDVFTTYCDTMHRLQELTSIVDKLYPSHNLPEYDAGLLIRAAKKFAEIKSQEAAGTRQSKGITRIEGQDFAILVRNPI